MDSADHRASQDLPSLPPRDDSPLPSSGLRRFLNRTTSTASLNTINTLLPQYSELTISDQEANTVTLWGDDLGVHRETIQHSQADDSDTTLAGGPSHSENSNPRVSIASAPSIFVRSSSIFSRSGPASHNRRGLAHRTHIQHLQWVEEQAMGYATCIQPTSARCFTEKPKVSPLLKWRYDCGFD